MGIALLAKKEMYELINKENLGGKLDVMVKGFWKREERFRKGRGEEEGTSLSPFRGDSIEVPRNNYNISGFGLRREIQGKQSEVERLGGEKLRQHVIFLQKRTLRKRREGDGGHSEGDVGRR